MQPSMGRDAIAVGCVHVCNVYMLGTNTFWYATDTFSQMFNVVYTYMQGFVRGGYPLN